MTETQKNIPSTKAQKTNSESFQYKENQNSKIISKISNKYLQLLWKNRLYRENFIDFLQNFLQKNNIPPQNIEATEYKNNTFYIYLKSWEPLTFSIKDIKNSLLKKVFSSGEMKQTEKKAKNLQKAIESIFQDNKWFFYNDEIDDDDIILTNDFDKFWYTLKWKTLKELKELLDIENKKLLKGYEITWESSKRQELLRKELQIYTGIWDKYEWWARYFSMSTKDINQKVSDIVSTMSINEVFLYIKSTAKQLTNNFKTADQVKDQNKKFMDWLYKVTYTKLKRENASNVEYIQFVCCITWRWELEEWNNDTYKTKTSFSYESLDMPEEYRDYTIANKVLLYVMYKTGWVIDSMKNEKLEAEAGIKDKEMENTTPKEVVEDIKKTLNAKSWDPKYADTFFEKANFSHLLNVDTSYSELNLEDKISIWSLVRISKILATLSPEELTNKELVNNLVNEKVWESFSELNDQVSDTFDGKLWSWGFDGATVDDLQLNWELWEVFHLYQDINGNTWFFDFKDQNTWEPWVWSIVFWVWIIAWWIIMSPLMLAWWTWAAVTAWAWSLAWAKLWLITWVASNVFSHQWYDTEFEAISDISMQLVIDIVISRFMTRKWMMYLVEKFWSASPTNMFYWWDSYKLSTWWLQDKWILLSELVLTFIASMFSSTVSQKVSKENHFNADKINYQDNLEQNWDKWTNFKNTPWEIIDEMWDSWEEFIMYIRKVMIDYFNKAMKEE